MNRAVLFVPVLAALLAAPAAGDVALTGLFASRVVEYAPGVGYELFGDPELALGGPRGLGWLFGGQHVVSLGVQGELVLGFEPGQAIVDADGPDFIVCENAFNRFDLRFAELVRVGVSTDGIDYAFYPTWCGVAEPVGPYGALDPALVSGFAGVEPVHANVGPPDEGGNEIDPFDPAVAGGDAYDLSDLAGDPLVTGGAVDLNRIYYVKLVDVLGDGSEQDSLGNAVYDPTGNMDPPHDDETSADIDAVTVLNGLPAPHPGDANRDGAVDGADYTIWADHYDMIGMTWDQAEFTGDGLVAGGDYTVWADNYGYPGTPKTSVPAPTCLLCLAAGGAGLLRSRRRGAAAGQRQ